MNSLERKTVRWREQDVPVQPLDLRNSEIRDRHAFFERASKFINYNGISGDYAEFGCGSAKTFRMAYDALCIDQQLDATLWAFDSFAGLPPAADVRDEHPKWTAGLFWEPVDLFELFVEQHGIPTTRYRTVPGYYSETIGPNAVGADRFAPKIALAYVDCDLYSSTCDVLYFLASRMRHGMLIGFDDYFCDSETGIAGERLALEEFLSANPRWHFVPYVQFGWHGQSFVIEDTRLRSLSRVHP